MAPLERKVIEKGLLEKGFRVDNKDHRYYVLYYNNQKTTIRTKISTSSKKHRVYGDDLLLAIRRQLKFDSMYLLRQFLLCFVSYKQYIQLLTEKGILKS